MQSKNIKYYIRNSGVIVRVINDSILEYLSPKGEWIKNQEWYKSMFIDGDDDFNEIVPEQALTYINEYINTKKMIR